MKNAWSKGTWIKLIVIGLALCLLIVFETVLMAHGGYMHQGRWWQSQKLAQELNLTDQEKQSLDALFTSNRDKLIDLKSALMKDRFKLDDLLRKDPVDEASVLAQNRIIEEDRLKVSDERIKFMLGMRKILGPDRYSKLTARYHEMMAGKRHGRAGQGFCNNDQPR
ncbi:MAG TPA: periplasmic heavy metal sensor [Desulfomonilia bacterium]|nr:periplasmic heavy metal sensor [Desulfomonilia bacterium]